MVEIKMKDEERVKGKVSKIHDYKQLADDFFGRTIQLEGDNTFHNVVGRKDQIEEIYGDVKVGDEVELFKFKDGNYVNVKAIKKIEGEEDISQSEETESGSVLTDKTAEKVLQKVEANIKMNDTKILKKSLMDAYDVISEVFKDKYSDDTVLSDEQFNEFVIRSGIHLSINRLMKA